MADAGSTNQQSTAAQTDSEPIIGLNIREQPNVRASIMGLLPRDSVIEIADHSPDNKWGRISKIVKGDIAPPQKNGSVKPEASTGWVFLGELEKEGGTPELLDAVYILPTPNPISAGSLIGYLGEYSRYLDATSTPPIPVRPLLHLEVFTGDDLANFMTQSRARSAQLDASQKTLLVIQQGAKLCQPAAPDKTIPAGTSMIKLGKEAGEGTWVRAKVLAKKIVPINELTDPKGSGSSGSFLYQGERVPFTGNYVNARGETTTDRSQKATYTRREILAPQGEAIWVESSRLQGTIERKGWSSFPLKTTASTTPVAGFPRTLSKSQLGKLAYADRAKDDKGIAWYRVEVGTADATDQSGWVCEKDHPQTSWKSPWDWPGFEVISEKAAPIELFSRLLDQLGAAKDAEEAANLKVRADAADGGPLFKKLRQAIDAQGNKDGKVDGDELRKALLHPWLAEQITKLIVNYESEWGGEMAKWDALDPLMVEGEPIWKAEKNRIKNLLFFKEITKIIEISLEAKLIHLNFIGVAGNFYSDDDNSDVIYLAKTLYGEARGQNIESKTAVAWVIRNRLNSGRWGGSYKSVVTAKMQFTCWSQVADPGNYAAIQNPSGSMWKQSLQVARLVVAAADSENIIPGAINYYSPTAQAQLHRQKPDLYPAIPSFAVESKRVENPPGVKDADYRFYKS